MVSCSSVLSKMDQPTLHGQHSNRLSASRLHAHSRLYQNPLFGVSSFPNVFLDSFSFTGESRRGGKEWRRIVEPSKSQGITVCWRLWRKWTVRKYPCRPFPPDWVGRTPTVKMGKFLYQPWNNKQIFQKIQEIGLKNRMEKLAHEVEKIQPKIQL